MTTSKGPKQSLDFAVILKSEVTTPSQGQQTFMFRRSTSPATLWPPNRAQFGPLVLGLSLFVGCPEPPPPPGTVECDTPREGNTTLIDGVYRVELPTLSIPSGTERFWCYYGVYEGETAGVVALSPDLEEDFLHHSLVRSAEYDVRESGTLRDCTGLNEQWPPTPVLFDALNGALGSEGRVLPDGVAFHFGTGLRWVIDSHYINTTDDEICVENAFEFHTIPEEEVEQFASAYALDMGAFELPAEQETTLEFDCTFPTDLNLLSLSGHMHGYGMRSEIQLNQGEGFETLYLVEEWDGSYGSVSPMITFEPDGLPIAAGDVMRTRCTWNNTSTGPLAFPTEMCTTFGAAFPLSSPLFCDAGIFIGINDHPGVLEGTVTRSVAPTGDAIGTLRIALFSQPLGPDPGPPFGEIVIKGADLSADDAEVPFRIENIPVSNKPYYVLAMLDDDESGVNQGPNNGDLIASGAQGQSPRADVLDEGVTELNLDLSILVE